MIFYFFQTTLNCLEISIWKNMGEKFEIFFRFSVSIFFTFATIKQIKIIQQKYTRFFFNKIN
jgi:hypothetical protein